MKTTNSRAVALVGLLMVLVAVLLCVRLAIAQQTTPPAAIEPAPAYVPASNVPSIGPGASGGAAGPGITPAGSYPAYPPGAAGAAPPETNPFSTGATEYAAGGDRTRQTEALRAEIDALVEQESYTRQLMSDYSRLVDENERATIARELTNVVGKHFDIRQNVRERELQRLENQLRALRDLHERRAQLRDEIVRERVRQLLRDLDGIGWGADEFDRLETRRGAAAMGTMPSGMMPTMGGAGRPRSKSKARAGGMSMSSGGSGMGMPMSQPKSDLPSIQKSLNNLKQLGLAMHNYRDTHDVFVPPVVYGPDGKTPHSWRVALLPWLDQKDLYQQYRFDEPWDSENNLQLLDKMPAVFRDPDAPNGTVFSSYFQLSGVTLVTTSGSGASSKAPGIQSPRSELTPEPNRNGFRIPDITDGTSYTLMLVEAKRNIPWTKPEDIACTNDKLPKFGGHHAGIFLAAFYDGSARRLPLNMNDATLRAIITPNANDPINPSALELPNPNSFPATGGLPQPELLVPPLPAVPGTPGGILPLPLGLPGGAVPQSPPSLFEEGQDQQGNLERSRQNLKRLGVAMYKYMEANNKKFAPPALYSSDGETPHSWRVALLPYLGERELYQQYRFTEPWDSENNRLLLKKMPAVFRDPSDPADSQLASYFQISGLPSSPGHSGWRLSEIHDGTSNTIMLVEAVQKIPWTMPEDIAYEPDQALPQFGGHYPDGFLAALYDGSARLIPLATDKTIIRALLTPNGDEVIDASVFDLNSPRNVPGSASPPGPPQAGTTAPVDRPAPRSGN